MLDAVEFALLQQGSDLLAPLLKCLHLCRDILIEGLQHLAQRALVGGFAQDSLDLFER